MPNAPVELNYQSSPELEKAGMQSALAMLLCALYVALLGVAGIVGMVIKVYTPPTDVVIESVALPIPLVILPALFLWSRRGMLRRSRRAVLGGRILTLGMCALFGFMGGAMFIGMIADRPRFDDLLALGPFAAVIFTGLVLFIWTAWLLGRVRRLLSQ